MFVSLYTAAAGALAQEQGLDVTANNAANLSTQGYCPDRAVFADLVHTGVQSGADAPKTGCGTRVLQTDTLFGISGGLRKTGKPLDFAAADGRGFFAVRTDKGTRYTRNGSFSASAGTDGQFYLADAAGNPVLDGEGQEIRVADGKPSREAGVFTFENLGGLKKSGGNLFEATGLSGRASLDPDSRIRKGYLEESGADPADTMADLIEQERAFELNARMVQISDEIAQTADNLR